MAVRSELLTAYSPELDTLTGLIETERARVLEKRGRGQSGLYTAIVATQDRPARELALRIAYECFRSRGYKDTSGLRQAPSALTVVNQLNRLHSGPKSAGAWLLYLAHRAGLIADFRSPRHKVTAQIGPRSVANLQPIFRAIEHELTPDPVLTEPASKPAKIRQNKLSPRDGLQSRGSDTTEAAARAVHGTGWRVNTYMLGVIDKCGLPDVRPVERELEQVRAERDSLFASRKELLDQADSEAAAAEFSEALAAHQYARELQNTLAEHAANEQALAAAWARARFPEFYVPARFDYRGRLYQTGSQLQYTGGSDLSRGLLEFARGARVGDLDKLPRTDELITPKKAASMYLKIHIANCWGIRGGHEKRGAFVEENYDNILRSVDDPANYEWWRQAKEPYQFLAAAHAFIETDVFRNDDAELHIPVTLDATNSGLQHCALLLRDTKLAPLVNMTAQYEPQDFYQVIAARAEPTLDRETVKSIIVPLIYGSAPSNTAGILAGSGKPFTKADYQQAVAIRESIWSEIPDVHALYERLRDIARVTARAGKPLSWTAPSGFTVAQDSRVSKTRPAIDAVLPTGRFQAWERYPGERLDGKKQASSFAANFVHSFDASLLASLIVSGGYITEWACAHDSIGVPAWHGWDLLKLAGNAMRTMHQPDNLGAAWAHWRELGVDIPDAPGTRGAGLPKPIDARNFYLWM